MSPFTIRTRPNGRWHYDNYLKNLLNCDESNQRKRQTVTRVTTLEAAQAQVLAVPAQVTAQQTLIQTLTTRLDALEKQATDTANFNTRLKAVEKKLAG